MSEFIFQPQDDLVEKANVTRLMRRHDIDTVEELVRRSIEEQDWFWRAVIEDLDIQFANPFHTVRDTRRGVAWTDWFVGGKINLTTNCLDRHRDGPLADSDCLIAEHENGTRRRLTYRETADKVDKCAAALVTAGVKQGDRVGAVMPMTA
jgi:acetyl-CoA synthetase